MDILYFNKYDVKVFSLIENNKVETRYDLEHKNYTNDQRQISYRYGRLRGTWKG